ncbi:MAG: TRAP transporter substrate-binding protein DctP [Candidatus Aminicenantes bacterium]|nr:TRAP transporter substrate-binding protein DctP [Candidatus Aminicenantes bacterium]
MIKKAGAILALAVLAGLLSASGPGAPAASVAGARPSGAVVIKIASVAPSRSPWDKALERVANDWERISNGAVQVRIYPGGIAGSEQDMIRKMRLGVLQGGVFASMGLAKIDPSVTVLCMPFLFHSREEFTAVFDRMKPEFEALIEAKGFKVMLWTLAGWVNFFAKSPVVEPDDLRTHKICVTADFPEIEQVWKRMGYEAVTGDMNGLMVQLQSGAVTALYLPALVAGSGQYFALAPHMLAPSLAPLIGGLLLSDKAWASIPAEFHRPFLAAVEAAAAGLYEETMSLEADALKMMKDNGLVVHEPSAEALAKWRAAADEAIASLIGSVFSKDVYDQVVAYVREYREAHGQ